MQKKGLWAVFDNNTSSYECLLKKATLPTLNNRTLQDLAILMFKVKNGMSLDYISELFQSLDTNWNLSNSDFMIPRFNMITFGKQSKKYLGPYLWRKLPIALRTSTEIDKFKRKIRKSGLGGHLTEDKCASECTLSVLDFQKKIVGPVGPQVFIFCRQNKYSGRQKLYLRINGFSFLKDNGLSLV